MTHSELTQRLETLERDNRRLKRVAVTCFALVAALGVLYAVSCSSGQKPAGAAPDAEKITAREFDVVDGAGKVRVKIAMNCPQEGNCLPAIELFDQEGKPATSISAGTLTVSGKENESSLLADRLQFRAGAKGSSSRVTAEVGSGTGGGGLLSLVGNGPSYVRVNANAPGVEIQDSRGYTMNLGGVNLTAVNTGQSSQTTADSIVMFGNDKEHHVIWRAP